MLTCICSEATEVCADLGCGALGDGMPAVRGEQCFVDPLGHHQDLLEGGDSLVGPQPEANAQVDEGAAGNVGDARA